MGGGPLPGGSLGGVKLRDLNYTDVTKLCHLASTGVLALFSLLLQMLPQTSKICPHVE